ncbi:MAG: hypothetical protein RBU29_11810, partial [bacterium]|nr:hypothetical protein [bacterium]
ESPSQGPREDGHGASQTFIQEYRFPEGIPQEWITAYRGALHAVEQIKVEKDSLREEEYYKKLEKALLQAARINQKIQAAASP